MGLSNFTIHIRRQEGFTKEICGEIAAKIAAGRAWKPVERAEDADISTAVYFDAQKCWITVAAQALEDDPEIHLTLARELSKAYHTAALAVGCVDSDYLYLNWLDAEKKLDLWAQCGAASAYGGRRSNFAAWEKVLADAEKFRRVMKAKRVFAEECMGELEGLLALPERQALLNAEDAAALNGTRMFYYASAEFAAHPVKTGGDASAEETGLLPELELDTLNCSAAELTGRDSALFVQNHGGLLRGLELAITGPAVDAGDLFVYRSSVQALGANGGAVFPLEWEEETAPDGVKMLVARAPELKIKNMSRRYYGEWGGKGDHRMILRFAADTFSGNRIQDITLRLTTEGIWFAFRWQRNPRAEKGGWRALSEPN